MNNFKNDNLVKQKSKDNIGGRKSVLLKMFTRTQTNNPNQTSVFSPPHFQLGVTKMDESKISFTKAENLCDSPGLIEKMQSNSNILKLKDMESKKLRDILSKMYQKPKSKQEQNNNKISQIQTNNSIANDLHLIQLIGDESDPNPIGFEENSVRQEIKKWHYYIPSIEFLFDEIKIIVAKKNTSENSQNLKGIVQIEIEISSRTLIILKKVKLNLKCSSKS